MPGRIDDLVRLIANLRRCFWLLAARSDDMVADLGLTASLRAVLEHLDVYGAQTVPQIAQVKSVKRQSIQAHVDQLREGGFVRVIANPAHRRSVLVVATAKGRQVFAEIKRRERDALRILLRQLKGEDIVAAAAALEAFKAALHTLEDWDLEGAP